MAEYGASRGVSNFVEFIGWCVVAVGLIILLLSLTAVSSGGLFRGPGYLAIFPGLVIAIVGLLLVVNAQVLRATVNTASHTATMLELSRQQIAALKAASAAGPAPSIAVPTSTPARQINTSPSARPSDRPAPWAEATAPPTEVTPGIYDYRGYRIKKAGDGFLLNQMSFPHLGAAQEFIDGQVRREEAATLVARRPDDGGA